MCRPPTRSAARRVWPVVSLLLAAACRSLAPAPDVIDDDRFMRALEADAGRLCESGAARTLGQLRPQLDRARLDRPARLPRPASLVLHPQELYRRRCPGVLVLCRIYKCDHCPRWHHASEGCAFVLTADGLAATARHSFSGDDAHFVVAATRDGRVLPVLEILAASEADDVAIVRLPGGDLSPIPLRDDAPAGADAAVLSHPRHHLYSLSTGVVARRAVKYGGISGELSALERVPTPVIEITADFGVGSSGAPILDHAGNAIGMAVSTTTVFAGKKADANPQMTIHRGATAGRILQLLGHPAP